MKNTFLAFACLASIALMSISAGCKPSDSKSVTNSATGTSASTDSVSAPVPMDPKRKRIILLNNTDSPFWDAARAGIKQAAEDLKIADKGFSAAMDSNDGSDSGQIERLRQYGTQVDIAAVIISPISSTSPAIAEELDNLRKQGVIVGCFDSDLSERSRSIREFYVGTNNITGGKVLGTAAKAIQADAQYVQFVGTDSQQNAIERMDGFASVYGKATEKDRKLDDADRGRARDNVRDVITRYPELSMLVGIWSYNAPAIVDVVKELNVRDKFKIVAFDAEQLAIEQMANGMIDAMVVQNPFGMGYDSVKYAFAKATGDTATTNELFPKMGQEGGNIRDTGLKVVVPDEGSTITSDIFKEFGESVQFMKLSEFQAWLKQYNLTSS